VPPPIEAILRYYPALKLVAQNAAKHVFVKKAVKHYISEIVLRSPAFPSGKVHVLQKLKAALEVAECSNGQKLELQQFGQLLGLPLSTNYDWFYGQLPPAIERFLCGIERLSPSARATFFGRVCRDCPRLSHPTLANNAIAIESVKALLEEPAGLVCILGPTAALRTFVMIAIGNSVTSLRPVKRLAGFDLHQPDLVVPAPGILYFRTGASVAQVQAQVQRLWSRIEDSSAEIVMLNGIWGLVPELQSRIVALSVKRNVLLADGFESGLPEGHGKSKFRLTTITALPATNQTIRLLIRNR
jgi:hypothetical protein